MQWQSLIELNHSTREYEVHLLRENEDGTTEAAAPIQMVTVERGSRNYKAMFSLPASRVLLQGLMDALWAIGLRPTVPTTQGADRHHTRMAKKLANLRRFAFDDIRPKFASPGIEMPVITPDYRARFANKVVKLTPTQALILTKVATEPGRMWSQGEIADAVYSGTGSKQPLCVDKIIRARICELRSKFASEGIDVGINGRRGRNGGFTFSGVKMFPNTEDHAA